jgi:hypothetical protein
MGMETETETEMEVKMKMKMKKALGSWNCDLGLESKFARDTLYLPFFFLFMFILSTSVVGVQATVPIIIRQVLKR